MRHQRARAVDRLAFLVAGDDQADRAGQGVCARHCSDEGRDRAFHVDRAAPVEQVAMAGGREGVARPALARRHDIDMAGKGEVPARPGRLHRQQVLDRRVLAFSVEEARDREAERRQHGLEAIEHRARRRRHRRTGDQRLGKRHGIGEVERIGHRAALAKATAVGKPGTAIILFVIPAKAGIQGTAKCPGGVGSRFRGNDGESHGR